MNDEIVAWVDQQRAARVDDALIRHSLAAAGWQQADIEAIMVASQPVTTKKSLSKNVKRLIIAGGVFIVLIFVLLLYVTGIIGSDKIAFTYAKCLDLALPESACQALEAIIEHQSSESWLAEEAASASGQNTALNTVGQSDSTLSVDLNSWVLSEVVNVESATICAETGDQLYLIIMGVEDSSWRVESIRGLAEGDRSASYCQAKN